MKETTATVETRGLSTGYRNKKNCNTVMQPLDATLRGGELTCLLGPNGAGKSTLLKTLSGFLPPLKGEVLFFGRSLAGYSRNELARTLGVVLTERTAPENMTVQQMVELGRSPYSGFWGRLGDNDRRIVDEALLITGTGAFRHRMVADLSDGERQKVMIAKVLAQQTPVIFLDEPTAFLDYPSKVETMKLLHMLSRTKGKTIFMSTHDLDLALQTADTVWLIDKKNGVRTGSPEDLSLDGSLARYFDNEGVVFDPLTGLFRLYEQCDRKIHVAGDPVRVAMAAKALARNGVMALTGADNNATVPTITASADCYMLDGERIGTVAALLDALRRRGIISRENTVLREETEILTDLTDETKQ